MFKFAVMNNTIRVERARRKISQEELADEVGLTRTAISYIENDKVDVRLCHALRIAKYFKLKIEEIFSL